MDASAKLSFRKNTVEEGVKELSELSMKYLRGGARMGAIWDLPFKKRRRREDLKLRQTKR